MISTDAAGAEYLPRTHRAAMGAIVTLADAPQDRYEIYVPIGEGEDFQLVQTYVGPNAEDIAQSSVNDPNTSMYYGGSIVHWVLEDGAWVGTLIPVV